MTIRTTVLPGGIPQVSIDASTGNESYPLPAGYAAGRRLIVRRVDSGATYTATVTVPTGGSIDGVTDGTVTIGADLEVTFEAGDGNAWQTTGSLKAIAAAVAARPELTGAYTAPDVIAPAPTGVAATDRAALLAAIAATPSGGILRLRRGTYAVDQAVTIDRHITIEGTSMSETFLTAGAGGALNHPNSPGGAGTVIRQDTAATDVIALSGGAYSVHLRDFMVTFGSGIIHTNTGHGFNFSSTTVPGGGGHATGLTASTLRNLVVYGHDGNHYGFVLLNPLYGTFQHLFTHGGGGFLVQCDSFEGNFGNLVLTHSYVELYNSGTADAYKLAARTNSGATGWLNLCTFIRPQANITGAAATAGTQKLWNSNGGAALPSGIDVISPDLETNASNLIDFGGVNSGTSVRATGIMNGTPTGGFDGGPGANYQAFTTAGTFSFKTSYNTSRVRIRATGGGGGGAGGGSALTSGGVTTQVGGGGGGAGHVTDAVVAVTPNTTYTVTVGAAGTAGAGGALNGNAGTAGGTGVRSSFHTLVRADGGAGGAAGGANSTTAVGGGIFGRGSSGTTTTQNIPGCGGPSQNPNGITAIPMPPGVVGGGGGGAATATNGGGGGSAATAGFPAYTPPGGGASGASGTAAGVDGTAATTNGCGGGGGGGGAPGGAGGNGGAAAAGSIEVWW
jgi:hypothetical protein